MQSLSLSLSLFNCCLRLTWKEGIRNCSLAVSAHVAPSAVESQGRTRTAVTFSDPKFRMTTRRPLSVAADRSGGVAAPNGAASNLKEGEDEEEEERRRGRGEEEKR